MKKKLNIKKSIVAMLNGNQMNNILGGNDTIVSYPVSEIPYCNTVDDCVPPLSEVCKTHIVSLCVKCMP
ncbi:MAG: hypothetical protein ACEPOV_14080 [Hyphomicrobiales bacterium]